MTGGWLARAAPLALALYAALALRDYLAPGLPLEFDAHSHLARSEFVARALAEGRWPTWTFGWYGGYRLLEFYSPGYFLLTGSLGLLLGVVTATKLVLWIGQLFTALALYGFGRRIGLSPLLALLAPVLFVESAQRGWTLGVVGNHPSVLVTAAAAAWLWGVAGPPRRSTPAFRLALRRSLVLGFATLGHLQALLVVPGLVVLDALWLAGSLGWRRTLAIVFGSLAGLAVLTSFVTLPMLVDLPRVLLSLDAEASRSLGAHVEPLAIAAGIEPFSWSHAYVRSHGLPWMVLGAAGALLSLSLRHRAGSALAAGLATNLAVLALFGDRAVLGVGLLLFPLCGLAAALLAERVRRPRAMDAGVLASALGVAALAGVVVAPPGGDRFEARWAPSDALAPYASLPATRTRSRPFDVTPHPLCLDGFYGASSASPLVSGRSVPFGAFPQGAPLSSQLGMALLGRLASERFEPGGVLSEESLDALYLTHVQFLVDRSARPRLGRAARASEEAVALAPGLVRLLEASPVLFAPTLADLAPRPAGTGEAGGGAAPLLEALRERRRGDPLDGTRRAPSLSLLARTQQKRDWELIAPIVRAMEIDRSRAIARRLFVPGPVPALGPVAAARGEVDGPLRILGHEEGEVRVRMEVEPPAAGFLRLAYGRDPQVRVLVDGRPVASAADALGAFVIAIPGGRHHVELRARTPAWRIALTALCASLWAAGIALLVGPWGPRGLPG